MKKLSLAGGNSTVTENNFFFSFVPSALGSEEKLGNFESSAPLLLKLLTFSLFVNL